jgi:hypothetical protein
MRPRFRHGCSAPSIAAPQTLILIKAAGGAAGVTPSRMVAKILSKRPD